MPKSANAVARRNLALGYSLPIIGGAIALIFGLIVADVVGAILDIWIWIIIQVILGASLVWGTRVSTMAHNHLVETGKKLGATKGARNLNFILGIIWSGVVAIMAFVNLSTAVGKLRGYHGTGLAEKDSAGKIATGAYIKPFTADIFFGSFLPAFVLLLVLLAGVFLLMSERNTEKFLTFAELRKEWDIHRAAAKAPAAAKDSKE
jgi:hypothetical protein